MDLQQVEHVSEVYIVNRGSDCGCPDRFKNFEIRVGRLIKDYTLSQMCNQVKGDLERRSIAFVISNDHLCINKPLPAK